MTAELVSGQNHALPGNRLEIRVSAGTPVVAAVTLGDEQGRVTGDDGRFAHPGEPNLPGVEVPRQAAADHRLAVDLGAVPEAVHRVHVLLALPAGIHPGGPHPGGPPSFGAAPAPRVEVTTPEGAGIAGFTVSGLTTETALLAVELYRRQGGWKIRAVGQGYAGGLPALLLDQGLPDPAGTALAVRTAVAREQSRAVGVDYHHPGRRTAAAGTADEVPGTFPSEPSPERPSAADSAVRPAAPAGAPEGPPVPVAGDAPGWSMEERLYNQVWGMFEDLARSVAAYRSAADFAQARYDQELDRLLADPRTRGGPAAEAARDQAEIRQIALVDQARAVLDRDLAQLTAEAEVVEPALPPAFAGWENPAWHAYQVPTEPPFAVRLGTLCLPEAPELRIPLLARLPLERGLWIDSAENRGLAVDTAVALAARLLAAHPVGAFALHVLDPAGSAATATAPLYAGGALTLPAPAAGSAGIGDVLTRLTERVDLVQMALRSDAADALPPGFDTAEQLLIVNEFPYGFDDRAITQLRYLADEGPAAGVHLMLVADREDAAAYGPLLGPMFGALLRLTPLPSEHLSDPWVGHAWTYEPALVPAGSQVLPHVLRQLADARPAYGS
ncbi:TerD family protein [Actinacidiphila acididurans]|uniref:TerD family protein n=1 Tax=Actinacidiphila acididurans TaxID=2784346 RepID=A0ABS2TQH9_9ACTN|nr:TerD family protein [Actinacidiphila acididurans]MBM9505593.1 TerD family protein [Actinacidiphila acididurans]